MLCRLATVLACTSGILASLGTSAISTLMVCMGAEETGRMLALLSELKPTHAILLVEHDMDAVFRVADRITVMVNGQVIASGKPADIRADANVQSAYLGEEH